jgi:hypothetical protein
MGSTTWPSGYTPAMGPRLSQNVGRYVAIYDSGGKCWDSCGFNWDIGIDWSNHADYYYNVGLYNGAVYGIFDFNWAATRATTYYGKAIYTWLDQQCQQ